MVLLNNGRDGRKEADCQQGLNQRSAHSESSQDWGHRHRDQERVEQNHVASFEISESKVTEAAQANRAGLAQCKSLLNRNPRSALRADTQRIWQDGVRTNAERVNEACRFARR